jgi:hypothetical protein
MPAIRRACPHHFVCQYAEWEHAISGEIAAYLRAPHTP